MLFAMFLTKLNLRTVAFLALTILRNMKKTNYGRIKDFFSINLHTKMLLKSFHDWSIANNLTLEGRGVDTYKFTADFDISLPRRILKYLDKISSS